MDCFSCDRYDSATYKHIQKKNGVKVISATENIADSPDVILLELLLDGMFGEHDKQECAVASRHMMMQEAAQIGSCIGAKRLWLTHCSPATLQPEDFSGELK